MQKRQMVTRGGFSVIGYTVYGLGSGSKSVVDLGKLLWNMFTSSHAPAWEFIPQRSRVAGRWSVNGGIPTQECGNEVAFKFGETRQTKKPRRCRATPGASKQLPKRQTGKSN